MLSPGAITNSVPDPDEAIRLQRDVQRIAQENASARSLQQSQIGAGGLLINGGGSLTIEGTGSLNVGSGALNSAGSITAATNITAGGTVQGGTVNSTGNMNVGGALGVAGNINLTGDLYTPHGLATPVTSGYFAAYINGDGRLGRSVSARRYKQDIKAWSPNLQAVFALQLVTYRLKSAVTELGDAAPVEYGLIADELVALGLGWLVIFTDGEVEGIAYEKIALALLPVVQDHERRLDALEAWIQSHTA